VHGSRLEPERLASADGYLINVSAIVQGEGGSIFSRSAQPPAGPRSALSRGGRDCARHCVGGQWPPGFESRRAERVPAGTRISVPATGQLWAQDLEGRIERSLPSSFVHIPLSLGALPASGEF